MVFCPWTGIYVIDSPDSQTFGMYILVVLFLWRTLINIASISCPCTCRLLCCDLLFRLVLLLTLWVDPGLFHSSLPQRTDQQLPMTCSLQAEKQEHERASPALQVQTFAYINICFHHTDQSESRGQASGWWGWEVYPAQVTRREEQ